MIAENLRYLRENISRKCGEIKRDAAEVTLIAVSKNFGTDEINAAIAENQLDFGENKAQELNAKYQVIGDKVKWHFIGTLQKNKVKYAVRCAEYIHSVDSFELAEEISRHAEKNNKVQKVLLQVKTSDEAAKAGFEDEGELHKTAEYCMKNNHLELTGLMTIAPFTDNKELIRKSFSYLRNLRNRLSQEFGNTIKELSMGMTDDYGIAIEEGATMLRIGSAIFGTRDYSKDWKQI